MPDKLKDKQHFNIDKRFKLRDKVKFIPLLHLSLS